jgi:cation diffusion facilitator family transporter
MALWLVLFSAIASLVVSRWELIQGRRLDSPLLVADAAHTRADVYASGAVLVGLLLVRAGMPLADPLVALGVAVVIARTGWQIVQETVPVLVDERAVEDRTIRRIAEATEGVRGAWGIRSRGRPGEIYAELTVSVDPTLDVADAHTIADQVERDVAEALRAREVTVHVEPDETPPPPPPPSAS